MPRPIRAAGAYRQLLILLLCVPLVWAQRANLGGIVLDTSGRGIGQAAITVVNEDTGFRRVAESESGGMYVVSSLDPGIYKVTVRKDGFRTMTRLDVALTGSALARADFILPVGSVYETITVRGNSPAMDWRGEPGDVSTGAAFQHDQIARMPLNGGGLLDLLALVPGVNITPATRGDAGQFTATGQRANTNSFSIDGVSANTGISAGGLPAQSTGGTLPAVSAFGSLDALNPLSDIQELQVETSTTAAQFGRMPGANVAVSSQTGSNGFHGNSIYQVRNELFSANDWFANRAALAKPAARLNSFAQTLGGPIQRDRTFFSLSFQHISLLQPYVQTMAVPSLEARQSAAVWAQPALNLFPLPNQGALSGGISEWTGAASQPAGLYAGTARIDRAIGLRTNLFARYSVAPSTNNFGGVEIDRLQLWLQSLTLGASVRPTANLTLESRVNESQSSASSAWSVAGAAACALQPLAADFLGTASCDTLVRFTVGGAGQVVSGREGTRRQRQFQAVQSAALHYGRHSLQIGADYRRITAVRRDPESTFGVIADQVTDLTSIQNLWLSESPPINQTARVHEFSAWALDTWQPLARLTISAGVRWEFSPSPQSNIRVNFYDPAQGTIVTDPQPRQLWPTDYRDLAPRFGVAYRLTADGRTMLRAGAGLYYDSSLSFATDLLNGGPLSIGSYSSSIHAPFSTQLSYGFLPSLKLPEVREASVSLEHALSAYDAISVAYAGAWGHGLIRRELGGEGNSPTSLIALTTVRGLSNYQALEAQYHRGFARHWQATASYTWSHSIDNDSSDAFLLWAGPGARAANDRGSSDFDLRHSFAGSLSYEVPMGILKGWRADAIFRARSGFPITVLDSEEYTGITLANAFRPNLVAGQPVWIDDGSAPGGRRLNPAAFQTVAGGKQGNLGRNSITGFGMGQLDFALGREFRLREKRAVDIRVEAFNAFNHANYADPVKFLDSPLIGNSASMLNNMLGTGSPGSGLAPMLEAGGPRMLQGEIRFRF